VDSSFAARQLANVANSDTSYLTPLPQLSMLIRTPPSSNQLLNELQIGTANGVATFGGGTTSENYVPGQSCLVIDPNSHFDPTKTLTLNSNAPAGWTSRFVPFCSLIVQCPDTLRKYAGSLSKPLR
jgi:hypothetical protein